MENLITDFLECLYNEEKLETSISLLDFQCLEHTEQNFTQYFC